MRLPDLKFGIVFRMRVNGGNNFDAVLRGIACKRGKSGRNLLGSECIQCARRAKEIQLRIDIDKDRIHEFTIPSDLRVLSVSSNKRSLIAMRRGGVGESSRNSAGNLATACSVRARNLESAG